jgi:hypothetical protein
MRDLNRKYGFRTNPEVFAKLVYVINHYNCLGILLRDRIVEANEVFQLNPSNSAHAIYTMYELWIIQRARSSVRDC